MGIKDYEEKFMEIKNEILKEIRNIISFGSSHHFTEKFYVHYIEGEAATTEICSGVEVCNDGMVVFIVKPENADKEEVIEGETVFMYDSESFLDILAQLKKEVREKKLNKLREIVKRNNGLSFDDGLIIKIKVCAIVNKCRLLGLRITANGKLAVINLFRGETFINEESALLDEDIDKLITYVESQTKQKFFVRMSGKFSRTFEIEAKNLEDAIAEAKKELKVNPLSQKDITFTYWNGCTEYQD